MALVDTITVTDANRDQGYQTIYKGGDGMYHISAQFAATHTSGLTETRTVDAVLVDRLAALVAASTITNAQRTAYIAVELALREDMRTNVANLK